MQLVAIEGEDEASEAEADEALIEEVDEDSRAISRIATVISFTVASE